MGYLDVKTEPVYFYATRPGEYKNGNNAVIITYPSVIAFNAAFVGNLGRFTAPVSGLYQFNFYGYAFGHSSAGDNTSDQTRINLLKNGAASEINTFNYATSNQAAELPLSFAAVLSLRKGDYIETQFEYGNIRNSHFSGLLLESELE